MEWRSARADDIEPIIGLWASAGVGGGADVDRAEIVERLREDDGFFVVGFRDGELLAVAMGCYDNHRGWLKRVAVSPTARGGGIGRALVAEVERRFAAAGITQLRLAVWDENEIGLRFWERLDYEELTDIRYFVKRLD